MRFINLKEYGYNGNLFINTSDISIIRTDKSGIHIMRKGRSYDDGFSIFVKNYKKEEKEREVERLSLCKRIIADIG